MKLEGFNKVAVVRYGCNDYHFALYDDDINIGDMVVLSGSSSPTRIVDIISVEYVKNKFNKTITQEVVGKVDTSSYDKRVEVRKKKEELKKAMEKRKKELQQLRDDLYYADIDDEFREMYRMFNEL